MQTNPAVEQSKIIRESPWISQVGKEKVYGEKDLIDKLILATDIQVARLTIPHVNESRAIY